MLGIRDHLFALLGLARDTDSAAFGLNYDEPFDLIVKRYAAEFVSRGQDVTLTALAGLNVKSDRFPSWIPDWTREATTQHNRLNSLIMESGEKIFKSYRASGASRPQMRVDIGLVWRSFSKHSRAQNFCIAEKEYIGLCAEGTRPRDNVCVLLGDVAPVVLWKSNDRDHHFRLAGECYIHGIMKGEAFESTDFNAVDLFLW
jgi:hypothetical protein